MSNSTDQLETVFQEINDLFSDHPQITVTPEKGDPPEEYSINYSINGMCLSDTGEIHECREHLVTLVLPFGFPHFPPSCKPMTKTFHPDFDPTAISLGDFWDEHQSITGLINHIGRMICGEIYSLHNAFNEEAASWYKDNQDSLPFDKLVSDGSIPSSTAGPQIDEIEAFEVDTLDDSDFGLQLEKAEPAPPGSDALSADIDEAISAAQGFDPSRLQQLLKAGKLFKLRNEVQTLPGDAQFEGRADLEQRLNQGLEQAEKLFAKAEEAENRGNPAGALDFYRKTLELAADYPELTAIIKRVKESQDLLEEFQPAGQKTVPSTEDLDKAAPEAAAEGVRATQERKKKVTFYEEEKDRPVRWVPITIIGGVLALLTTFAVAFFSISRQADNAATAYKDCEQLLATDDFTTTERKCEEALDLARGIRFNQSAKRELVKKATAALATERLRQGLTGNILVDGKYVNQATKKVLADFKEARLKGDSLMSSKSWEGAIASYKAALSHGKNEPNIDPAVLQDVKKQLNLALFNSYMKAGEKSLAISDWSDASINFEKALKLAKLDPNISPDEIQRIELLSNQTAFNRLRDEGKTFFDEKKWAEALSAFTRAEELSSRLPKVDAETRSVLKENIVRTKIYHNIAKGKSAFTSGGWDEAISSYETAIGLLNENTKILSRQSSRASQVKLARIMTQAAVIRDKQKAASFLKEKDYNQAIVQLKGVINTIKQSDFSKEKEFQAVIRETRPLIEEARLKIQHANHIQYLTDNYARMFVKNNPSLEADKLTRPKVSFLKKKGSSLIYSVQCSESGHGRPVLLQARFLYSPATGRWQFYSGD
ncbi:MAG: hypothetical protein ABFS19_08885 [Thermodesulfobacteriota bacterium]